MILEDDQRQLFQETVWAHYSEHARHDLPWRQPDLDGTFDPYKIMVSELMLQQTQVQRVIPKYKTFLKKFPNAKALSRAALGDVLREWAGLGYNRRAKYLHNAAQMIADDFGGIFPQDQTTLTKLPGVGINTAGAIAAYAYNQPVVFIETNIKTALIHHFFADHTDVSDKDVLAVAEQVLNTEQPREWYWALMDYGSHLKQTVGNANRQSKSYTKQSSFNGSKRQIRGQVIALLSGQTQSLNALQQRIPDDRLQNVVSDLLKEGLITETKDGNLSL
ncbi:MAG: A/G-specific adenine glycosylase [Patescibacteria group bacterium]|nr:A/G-specific adenine glycosylase [Patescibacteria group bacterium]